MKKISVLLCFMLISDVAAKEHCCPEVLREYINSVVAEITQGDFSGFREVAWNGTANPEFDEDIESDLKEFLFGQGSADQFSVKAFFDRGRTTLYCARFGQEIADGRTYERYLVILYYPDVLDFKEDVSYEQMKTLWQVGYVETIVLVDESSFTLTRYPFSYGTSPSWVPDY